MAERRMFAKSIVLSDAFLDMPMSARCLYFTLAMFADDDGFVGSPKGIMRQCGASQDDMLMLLQKRYILGFESGVIVIKHWRINNYLQSDRHKPTTYLEELESLAVDEKNAYTEKTRAELPQNDECIQNVSKMYTQYSIGKESIGKESEGKERENPPEPNQSKPVRHKHGEYSNVLLTDEELAKLKQEYPHDWDKRIERLSSYIASTGKTYKNHLATIRNWARMDKEKGIGEAPKSKNRSFTADNVKAYEEWSRNAIRDGARGTV